MHQAMQLISPENPSGGTIRYLLCQQIAGITFYVYEGIFVKAMPSTKISELMLVRAEHEL